jgi:glycosyltransferase involved in cell wall biosynthesis
MEPWIVIPAYNEEKKIEEVVTGLKKAGYLRIVVVDDGSKDGTGQKAYFASAIVLKHIANRGQGAALRTGIEYALENEAEIIVTFDSDGQHQPEDIAPLILPLQEGKAEVALGSRFLNFHSNTPLVRKIFLKGGAGIFRAIYGVRLTDSHNGLRAFSKKAAQAINITQDRMEHASEIIEEISKKRLKYVEVPVTIKYTSYSLQHGQKTSNAFKILLKMFVNKLMR